MFESKYGKLLTVILVIVVIAIIGLLGFLGYDVFKKFTTKKTAAQVAEEFENTVTDEENTTVDNTIVAPILNEVTNEQNTTNTETPKKVTYKGYNVVGTIEIPKIDLKYPILERVTTKSIEVAVAVLYGPGPNQVGNTVIVGHNYRNGSFFGNNDKLEIGDKIYITDTTGNKVEYKIYNIYETSPDDSDYMSRDTKGKREISLSTCTDNSKARLIIWAAEQ